MYNMNTKNTMNTKMGSLEIIIGNMFSGKSTELIRRINSILSINKNIINNSCEYLDMNNEK